MNTFGGSGNLRPTIGVGVTQKHTASFVATAGRVFHVNYPSVGLAQGASGTDMNWQITHRADKAACRLADRHYSRQSHGTLNFMPPGRCLILVTPEGDAVWGTSWPFAEYVRHEWAGAWICSIFRNETGGRVLSSDLIRQALSVTRWYWQNNPLGMVTFVDTSKTRHKRDPGRCFRKAGFRPVGYTKGGLVALQINVADMPPAEPPIGASMELAV